MASEQTTAFGPSAPVVRSTHYSHALFLWQTTVRTAFSCSCWGKKGKYFPGTHLRTAEALIIAHWVVIESVASISLKECWLETDSCSTFQSGTAGCHHHSVCLGMHAHGRNMASAEFVCPHRKNSITPKMTVESYTITTETGNIIVMKIYDKSCFG